MFFRRQWLRKTRFCLYLPSSVQLMVPVTLCRAHWLADTDKKWTLLHIPWTGLLHPLFPPPPPTPSSLLFLSYSCTHAFSLSLFLLCFFISPCCSPLPPPPFPLPFASFPLFIPVLFIGKRKRERVNKFCCCGIDFFFFSIQWSLFSLSVLSLQSSCFSVSLTHEAKSVWAPAPECLFSLRVLLFCFVCWLLIVPATCECISGTDLHRQFYVLPHWDRSCRSNFPSHPVTVYWHRADQSQCWPYNAWQGCHWSANF